MTESISETVVWPRMGALFGEQWERAHGGAKAEKHLAVWDQVLKPFTEGDVEAALVRLAQSGAKFPPSLPEFRRMVIGFPSLSEAVEALMEGRHDHPWLELALTKTGSWLRKNLSRDALRNQYTNALDATVVDAETAVLSAHSAALPPPPKQEPPPPKPEPVRRTGAMRDPTPDYFAACARFLNMSGEEFHNYQMDRILRMQRGQKVEPLPPIPGFPDFSHRGVPR